MSAAQKIIGSLPIIAIGISFVFEFLGFDRVKIMGVLMLFNLLYAIFLYGQYKTGLKERKKADIKHRQEWLQREKEKLGLPP